MQQLQAAAMLEMQEQLKAQKERAELFKQENSAVNLPVHGEATYNALSVDTTQEWA